MIRFRAMLRLPAPRALGVVSLLALAAVLSLFRLDGLEFRHDSRSLLRRDDRARAAHEELVRRFGSEDILLVAWEVDDALDRAAFRELREVTDALSRVEGLEEVYSLASPDVLLPIGPGGSLRPLQEDDLVDPSRKARARAAVLAAPVYLGTICNAALDVVAVAGTLAPRPPAERVRTLERVRAIAARHERPGRPVHVAGVTALAVDAARAAVHDLRTVGGIALLASVLVLLLVCGSLPETLVAVVVTGLPPLYALGLAGTLHLPITALGAALFPVLAVVGMTTSIHLLHAYAEERARGHSDDHAARLAARRLAAPIVLSLLTTAAAFLALQATGVPAFLTGGRVVALGLLCAIPVVLFGLPALLAFARPRPREPGEAFVHRLLAGATRFALRRRATLVAGALLLAGGATLLAAHAPLRVDVLQAFRPESRIARTYRFLDERLTATLPVDVVLRVGDAADRTRVIEELDRFARRVLPIEGVESALSAATLVRYGRSISPVDPGDAGALVFLRAALPRILRHFEDPAHTAYRVKLRVREGTPPGVLDRIEQAARSFTVGRATVQGLFVQAVATTRSIRSNLLFGVLGMGLGVAILAMVAKRSLRAGLAALLPNVVPAALVFGGAALAGLPLDVSAVAVGGVAVGLAVDDTLHLLWRFSAERRAGRSVEDALVVATTTVGRALLGSTLVLAAGLGSLAFSSFLPTARFGLFAAAATVLALFSDVLLVPALLGAGTRREGARGRTMPGMHRYLGWLVAAIPLLVACEDDSSNKEGTTIRVPATGDQPPPVEAASPPTGIVKIEEGRKSARDDLERIEAEVGDRAPNDEQRRSLGFVRAALEKVRTAAEIASRQEARQLVEERYGRLRKQQGDLESSRSKVWSEIAELQQIVDGIEKGTATPPSGFSEAELRDKLDDARARAADIDKQDTELRAQMKVCEDLLAQDVIDPTDRTRFTDELEAIAALQARVEALLAR